MTALDEIAAERLAAIRRALPVLEWCALNRRKLGPIATLALSCLHECRSIDRAAQETPDAD